MEMLVYIAMLVALLAVMVQMTVTISKTHRSTKVSKNIESAAVSAMERITRDTRNAIRIDMATSTLSSNPGAVGLVFTGTPSAVRFYSLNNRIYINEDSVNIGALTPEGVTVTNLVFRKISSGTLEALKVEMTIQGTLGDVTRTKNFYSTVVLRGTY